jgi:arsenate reductase/ArsR family transcriptional regulator
VYYRRAERDLNPYAQAFLGLVRGALKDDPTVAGDAHVLAQVTAAPLALVCDQGRAALDPRPQAPDPTA